MNADPGAAIPSRWRAWLRSQKNRTGAVYYYLHAIAGYTPSEIAATAPYLELYQLEELALLGIAHRHADPEAWRKLVR